MSSRSRIAVIVPCFNGGATLVDTLASLNEPEPLELVVVDDGSTEATTLEVLEDIGGQGVRVLRQENGGPSAALMAGVRATSSPYVVRFDSDDLAERGALADLADALDRNPTAAAAWGDIETFGLSHVRIPSVPQLDPWHLTYTNGLPAAAMFRRSALLDAGGWVLREGYEDWDLWMALAERGARGVYVPRLTYRYRRTGAGRHSGSLVAFDEHYSQLRARHPVLFTQRSANRRRSTAPWLMKVVLPLSERIPLVPRLPKVELAQALTVLLWNGGPRACLRLVAEGLKARRAGRRSVAASRHGSA